MPVEDDRALQHKRREERLRRLLKAHMLHPRHGQVDILVRNVSRQGIGGRCDVDLIAGETVTICLPSAPPVTGRVAWRAGLAFGVRLDDPIDPLAVRKSAEKAGATYQAPEYFQPDSDFKRPGFGHRGDK